MPEMKINLEGDGAFNDEKDKFGADKMVFLANPVLKVARLPNGTSEGRSATLIGFEYKGEYIVIQTTLALFKAAAQTMETRDRMEGRPE